MQYLLMNQDTPWLLFTAQKNEFDEVECCELEWYSPKRPYGYYDLTDYLRGRQAPKHRKHITELLERYGCNDLEGFLNITHALSLNDTFWVKPEASSLCWADVSLYRNPFDELVSAAAFDGRPGGTSLSSTSPEFGTDGYFAKCWVREGQDILLYKCGSDTFEVEPLSEFLATQVAERICPEVVCYDLDYYHDRLVSKCRLFTSEQLGLVKAHDILPQRERSISGILRRFEELGFGDEFRRMCVLDAHQVKAQCDAVFHAGDLGKAQIQTERRGKRQQHDQRDHDHIGNDTLFHVVSVPPILFAQLGYIISSF